MDFRLSQGQRLIGLNQLKPSILKFAPKKKKSVYITVGHIDNYSYFLIII